MVDLSLKAAHDFWGEYQDPTAYLAIIKLEARESWGMDTDKKIADQISSLENVLDKVNEVLEPCYDSVVRISAHIRTSRYLLLMQELDRIEPGTSARIINYAEDKAMDSNIYSLFLRRHLAFERYRILARVFASERVDIINGIVEQLVEG